MVELPPPIPGPWADPGSMTGPPPSAKRSTTYARRETRGWDVAKQLYIHRWTQMEPGGRCARTPNTPHHRNTPCTNASERGNAPHQHVRHTVEPPNTRTMPTQNMSATPPDALPHIGRTSKGGLGAVEHVSQPRILGRGRAVDNLVHSPSHQRPVRFGPARGRGQAMCEVRQLRGHVLRHGGVPCREQAPGEGATSAGWEAPHVVAREGHLGVRQYPQAEAHV